MEQKTHGSPSFINIAVLLLFAVVIAVASTVTTYFFLGSRSGEQSAVIQTPVVPPAQTNIIPTTPPTTQATIPADETTGWKVYKNTRYGYSIKYPTNWFVNTTHSEKDFTQRGGADVGIDYIGGDTTWSNYSKFDFTPADLTPDLQSVFLMIYKINPNTSYDQFISDTGRGEGIIKKEYINIKGINTLRLTSNTGNDHPTNTTVVNTFIKISDRMFLFNYSGDPIPQGEKDIADKMINLFTIQ